MATISESEIGVSDRGITFVSEMAGVKTAGNQKIPEDTGHTYLSVWGRHLTSEQQALIIKHNPDVLQAISLLNQWYEPWEYRGQLRWRRGLTLPQPSKPG